MVRPSGTATGEIRRPALPEACIGGCLLPGIKLGGEAPADESTLKASKASASHGFTPGPSIRIGN